MINFAQVTERLNALPPEKQQEVLDFIEFLARREESETAEQEERAWQEYSLSAAMRGLENEEDLYTLSDIREQI